MLSLLAYHWGLGRTTDYLARSQGRHLIKNRRHGLIVSFYYISGISRWWIRLPSQLLSGAQVNTPVIATRDYFSNGCWFERVRVTVHWWVIPYISDTPTCTSFTRDGREMTRLRTCSASCAGRLTNQDKSRFLNDIKELWCGAVWCIVNVYVKVP